MKYLRSQSPWFLTAVMFAACGNPPSGTDASTDVPGNTDVVTPDGATTDGAVTDAAVNDATPLPCGTMRPDISAISHTEGLVIGADGTIYYSQPGGVGRMQPGMAPENMWVRGIGPATGTVWGIALDVPHHQLYVGSPSTQKLYTIDLTAATPSATMLAVTAGQPNGLTMGPDGALYFSDFGGGNVFRVDSTGASTRVTTTTIPQANGVAFAADGSLYVDGYAHGTLTRLVLAAGVETSRTVVATGLGSPDGLAFDALGQIYVTDQSTGSLIRLDADGTNPMMLDTGINAPANIEFGAGPINCQDIYVASGGVLFRDTMGTTAGADVPWHH